VKYMFILVGEEHEGFEDASPEQVQAVMDGWAAFDREVADAGVFVAGEGLQESSTATTLRIREQDEPIVTDGPFAETKEQLGGFYVLDCADLDEALTWAKRIPLESGAIEVRPVMDYEAMGYTHISEGRKSNP
jgi:hypothetical protein